MIRVQIAQARSKSHTTTIQLHLQLTSLAFDAGNTINSLFLQVLRKFDHSARPPVRLEVPADRVRCRTRLGHLHLPQFQVDPDIYKQLK